MSNNKPTIPAVNFSRLVKPDLLNNCPYLGTFPVWIAPGDVAELDDPRAIMKNKNLDFQIPHHQKYCITTDQFTELWDIGLCHNGKYPRLNPVDGRLICFSDSSTKPPSPGPIDSGGGSTR